VAFHPSGSVTYWSAGLLSTLMTRQRPIREVLHHEAMVLYRPSPSGVGCRLVGLVELASLGLLAGLGATTLMTLLESLSWKRWGLVGVLEWHENQTIWSRLSGSDPSVPSPFGIFFFHFLNGSLAAVPFPIVAQALSRLGGGPLLPYPLGLAYGALLWCSPSSRSTDG
jgi:hypothetical protein